MTNQCEHGSLARTCPLCEANAEIAALRAEVEKLRGYLQDSVRAETSGDGSLIVTKRVTKEKIANAVARTNVSKLKGEA